MDEHGAARITVPQSVLHQEIDSETILFDVEAGRYYGLNEIGTRIWQLAQQHGAVAPIVATLLEEYAVDEATLRGDIEGLIGQLVAAGLIEA